ncbi:hypothetical protein B0H66DRAFT_258302 [Apodospora peruviana]|uniref:Uncharacterized protein n=1 Tax=Apodospora peruviana TaxID=516989 RepID=A0AAE0I7Q0_9PEZI|nr:hypothetical protein B0H66DRAFT_258302 [Apodospora peruviana]
MDTIKGPIPLHFPPRILALLNLSALADSGTTWVEFEKESIGRQLCFGHPPVRKTIVPQCSRFAHHLSPVLFYWSLGPSALRLTPSDGPSSKTPLAVGSQSLLKRGESNRGENLKADG